MKKFPIHLKSRRHSWVGAWLALCPRRDWKELEGLLFCSEVKSHSWIKDYLTLNKGRFIFLVTVVTFKFILSYNYVTGDVELCLRIKTVSWLWKTESLSMPLVSNLQTKENVLMGNCLEKKVLKHFLLWNLTKYLAIGNFLYNVQTAELGMLIYPTQETRWMLFLDTICELS